MPIQDLTPQLRTRLSRVERAVGWFVMLATALLLAGFGYYLYATAQRKGWFLIKLRYNTAVQSAAGLHVGDPVMMMGFDAGQIVKITPMPPFSTWGNIYVEFVIREPYFGYIWTDSYVKLVSAGFLGSRVMEVVQGGTRAKSNEVLHASYRVELGKVLGVWDPSSSNYVVVVSDHKGYSFLPAEEAPPVTERLEAVANEVRLALPGIFDLTNHVAQVLSNIVQITAHTDTLLVQAQPVLTNVAVISGMLTNGNGALGDWVIPTNINTQIQQTLASATTTLNTANTNVAMLGNSLNATLENLANITGNLNAQVQTNDQILTQISSVIVNADELVQGLKRHWLLRSAFKTKPTNAPPAAAPGKSAPGTAPITPDTPKVGKRIGP